MSMIERVARAIQDRCRERGFNVCPAPLVHHIAAAAIEAMREPTEEMVDACDINIPTEGMIYGVWRDMIDAALKEP